MKTPNLIPNILNYYRNIRRSEGERAVTLTLSAERASTKQDLRLGRITPEEAQEMLDAYNEVENALRSDSV